MPTVDELARRIAGLLDADGFPEPGGVWLPSPRPVARLGLALEPDPGLEGWVRRERLDALFLHRPWGVEAAALPDGVGVLWSHGPFDERLAIGPNPHLAAALGMADAAPFGEREGRPLGMIGSVAAEPAAAVLARIAAEFGGCEAARAGTRETVARIAAVGAMTDALVRAAADAGAELYLTGQLRQPALRALARTGLAVVAVGHRRSETWGLHTLAHLLAAADPTLTVVVRPADGG